MIRNVRIFRWITRSQVAGKLARRSTSLRGKHPRRSGTRHESVSFRRSIELVGGTLSGQPPQRRKGQRRPHHPGQPLAAGHLVAVCVGRSGKKGLLLEGQVLALGRGRQKTGYCGRGTYVIGAGLPSLRTGETLSGTASTVDRGPAEKAPDPTSCTQSGSARNQRRIQLPASRFSHVFLALCASIHVLTRITCTEQYFRNNPK